MGRRWVAVAAMLGACATPAAPTKQSQAKPAPATVTTNKGVEPSKANPKWKYPPSRIEPIKDTLFGVEVADPYRWLEDVKSPDVQAWMKVQDEMTRAELGKFAGRDALEARLKQLLYVDATNLPTRHGKRYFYSRNHADREKAIYYWREGLDGKEQVLLDPNRMSTDGSVSIGFVKPSWDGKRVAYSIKRNNSDESTLKVLDLDTGKESDEIDGAKYADPQWTPKNDGFYYAYLPPLQSGMAVADRPGTTEIRFHKLGTDAKSDALIHPATKNPKTFLGVELARDGKLLFVNVRHGWNSTDYWYKDLTKRGADKAPFTPLVVGKPFRYEVESARGKVYIYSNEDAPRFRLFVADPKKLDRKDWRELIAQGPDPMTGFSYVGGSLVTTYLHNATALLQVHGLDGKLVRAQALPGLGTLSGVTGDEDSDELFYAYQSFVQPREIYRASTKTAGSTLWGGANLKIDAAQFETEQVWSPSKDGTKISMFVVRKKGAPKDGSVQFLLTGYGGFNISRTPMFLGPLLAWIEAGGGYALPNLRGGGEYGEEWHKAGMLDKKQNVFDDFVGAAQFLVDAKYTSTSRLAIRGGSNGGLLVGAAMTQRPDLFRAVVCAVPLLDMVRYHLFGSGKTWIPEYGSAETEAGFKTLFAYSPYHHVAEKTAYPALLMLGADSDDRVDPMHARKLVAMVQARTSSELPVLLRVEKNAGHGGADLIKQTIAQEIDVFAFLKGQLQP